MNARNQEIRREEEMRISKMLSEGGQGIQAYYYNDYADKTEQEVLAAKEMIDEGGLGAEIYYNENEKIAKIDMEDKSDYVN